MESGAVLLGDMCSGHGPYPPRPNDQASNDVEINGKGSHRLGDHWISHCAKTCHDSVAASGSISVLVNDKPKCRVGDLVACGSTMVSGSSDVIVGDTVWSG